MPAQAARPQRRTQRGRTAVADRTDQEGDWPRPVAVHALPCGREQDDWHDMYEIARELIVLMLVVKAQQRTE